MDEPVVRERGRNGTTWASVRSPNQSSPMDHYDKKEQGMLSEIKLGTNMQR